MKKPIPARARLIRPVRREDLPPGALASLDPETNVVVVDRALWGNRTSLTVSQLLGLQEADPHLA